jgi:hypothetical protein
MKLTLPPPLTLSATDKAWTFDLDDPDTVAFIKCLYMNWLGIQPTTSHEEIKELITALSTKEQPPRKIYAQGKQ